MPSITTDVGSCRQLIEGLGEDDRAFGPAGAVVPIANPAAFAQAALDLLGDAQRWQAAQQAGLSRVRRFYTRAQMIDRYRALYDALAIAPDRMRRGRPFEAGCPVHHAGAGVVASGSSKEGR